MTILFRILRTTFQNIFRHGLTSLVAILIITLLSFLMNMIIFANFFQEAAVSTVNQRLDLAVNFSRPVQEIQVASLTNKLNETFPEIRAIKFISSEEAFTNFLKNFNKSNPKLTSWLEFNTETSPLPATLVVSVDAKHHSEIVGFLRKNPLASYIDLAKLSSTNLSATAADKILQLDQTLSRISSVTAISFIFLASLIIIAVLRLAILSRYSEVTVMRLVGATKEFIRIPFVLEGILLSVTATLIGSIAFLFLIQNFDSSQIFGLNFGGFTELFALTKESYIGGFALLLSWQVLAAALIGIVASVIATRKYLKHQLVLS